VWYDHLPYLEFPDNWPVFSPKDKIADWLEMYTRVMEIDYWGSTPARGASYDEAAGKWRVVVELDGAELVLRPHQLVLATGMSSQPNIPQLPGQDVFRGEQHHSSRHPGPDAYAGKRVVVVGSNNSAFDICGALWEVGADVTMVQRSSTHIVRSETLMDIGLGDLYSQRAVDAGVTTEKADTIFASLPYRIMHEFQIPLYDQMRERDADYYDRPEKAGFVLDWGPDGSGLFMKYLRRGSGYYIDVGAAELVADGKVKLASGQVDRLTEDAIVLTDGTELPADLVVYATGYQSMNGWVAELMSQEMADLVGKVWGLGSDTPKDPQRGRASSATCGNRPSSRRCGSTAATCISRATTRCTSRSSSRRAPRGSTRRCMGSRRSTTPDEGRSPNPAEPGPDTRDEVARRPSSRPSSPHTSR
jgi:putative flavoprotein involved in K+ transport